MKSKAVKTQPFYKGQIPADWTVATFGELFEFLGTFSFSRENLTNEKTEGGIQYIHYGDIHSKFSGGILDFEAEPGVPYLKDGVLDARALGKSGFPFLKDGDLVLADASEDYDGIGQCIEVKNLGLKKVISGLHTIAVRPKSNATISGFNSYLLRNPNVVRELCRIATGISVLSLSKGEIKKVSLAVPPITEQRKILETLDSCQGIIEKYASTSAALGIKFRGRLKNMVSLKASENSYVRMGNAFKERRKLGLGNLPLLSITREEGIVLQDQTSRKDVSKEDKSNYLRIEKGDIGYNTMRMWQGVSALSSYDGIVSPAYTVCTPNRHIILPEYASHLFKNPWVIHQFYRHSQGLTSDTWNLKFHHFSEIKLPIPNLNQQKSEVDVLDLARYEIRSVQKIETAYRQQKRGLMQKLLTGEWRIR